MCASMNSDKWDWKVGYRSKFYMLGMPEKSSKSFLYATRMYGRFLSSLSTSSLSLFAPPFLSLRLSASVSCCLYFLLLFHNLQSLFPFSLTHSFSLNWISSWLSFPSLWLATFYSLLYFPFLFHLLSTVRACSSSCTSSYWLVIPLLLLLSCSYCSLFPCFLPEAPGPAPGPPFSLAFTQSFSNTPLLYLYMCFVLVILVFFFFFS